MRWVATIAALAAYCSDAFARRELEEISSVRRDKYVVVEQHHACVPSEVVIEERQLEESRCGPQPLPPRC